MTMPFDVPGLGAPAMLRGERRYATVLVADVVNSTPLLEAVGSEAWVEIMNRVFQIAGSEIYRYGGEIDQFRGDGLVAFFGATGAHENDPERAVLAGLRMQAAVGAYAEQLTRQQSVTLTLRVGINTGEVIVTQIGDRGRHTEQTAMGEAVALAARMETSAEPGTVLVSQNTYRLVSSRFDWLPLGSATVKGVSHPVEVYRPVSYRERTSATGSRRQRESLAGLDSPLVGRQAQFRALQRAVQTVREGRGGVVTVVGEAGIGKSRLVAEVRLREERAAGRPLLWSEGRSLSLVGATPYLPWTTILRQLLGLGGRGPSELGVHPVLARSGTEERALLRGRIAALGIGVDSSVPEAAETWQSADQQAVTRALARILAIHGRDNTSNATGAMGGLESAVAPLVRAVSAVIEAVASRFPLVLAFEDVHWADAGSLLLLERVLPLVEQVPLLVICVMRPIPEGPPETGAALASLLATLPRYGEAHTEILLESLVPEEVAELVGNLLTSRSAGHRQAPVDVPLGPAPRDSDDADGAELPGTAPALSFPAPMVERILGASGGNPYFVEEFVRSLLDRGHLICDGPVCRWEGPGSVGSEVPDSLRGVLAARMDRLPTAARRCLQVGAVIGRIFSRELLAAVLSDAGPAEEATSNLGEHLRLLVTAQMIRPRGGGPFYIFKHQLMQEAAYGSLLQGERRQLHRYVAQELTSMSHPAGAAGRGDDVSDGALDALAGTLAHHWIAAGEPARAIPYLLSAGRQAQSAYAHDTARVAFHRVLEAIDALPATQVDTQKQARWLYGAYKGLGQVAFAVGRVEDAEDALRRAIALGRELALPLSDLIALYHWLGEVLFWQERYNERIELGKEGLSLLDPGAETVEVALMNQMVAIGHLTKGEREAFLEYTFRTANFIDSLPYIPELLPAYEHIIKAHLIANNLDKAEATLAALTARVDLAHDLNALAATHRQRSELRLARGDLEGALAANEEALALYERLGDTKHRVWAIGDKGWIRLQMGDLRGAESWLSEMERTAPTLTHYRGLEYIMQGKAMLGLITGDLARARAAMVEMLAQVDPSDPPMASAWPHFLLAQIDALEGRRAQAVAHLRTCLQHLAPVGQRSLVPAILTALSALATIGGPEALDRVPDDLIVDVPWGVVMARPTPITEARVLPGPSPSAPPIVDGNQAADFDAKAWFWVDPMGDGALDVGDGLTISAPNGRDLWESNVSAPRVVRAASGDLYIQVRVCQPAVGRPALGGPLIYWDDGNYLRLDIGTLGGLSVGLAGTLDGKSQIFGAAALPEPPGATGVLVRLERIGATVNALAYVKGVGWCRVGTAKAPERDDAWIGVYAIGNIDRTIYHGSFPEGTAIRFSEVELRVAR